VIEAAAGVSDWAGLAASAEYHGLSPLIWHHGRACGVDPSAGDWKQIAVLVLRHRDLGRAQAEALGEIVDALDAARIDFRVLKGAVLAHLLYSHPDLRPMSDLDILVAPSNLSRTRTVLDRLGFVVAFFPARPTQRFHHHLPVASRELHGVTVSVEIHRDALSGDSPGTLRLGSASRPFQEITVGGHRLRAFGHEDMLVHLTAHALQPADDTRLIGVADLVGYAARYASEIDWAHMQQRHPRVVNALTLMHHLTPLPESLRFLQPRRPSDPPPGVGRSCLPLSVLASPGRGTRQMLRDLVYPSEWWMRAYYGVPSSRRSLFGTRWSRHVSRVAYWSGRRLLASLASLGAERAGE
jgi:hypothetical protein